MPWICEGLASLLTIHPGTLFGKYFKGEGGKATLGLPPSPDCFPKRIELAVGFVLVRVRDSDTLAIQVATVNVKEQMSLVGF